MDGECLGDTIAFFPFFDQYRHKHNVELVVATAWNCLFDASYPDIEFIPQGATPLRIDEVISMKVELGLKRGLNYQRMAAEQLGLEYVEVRPRISTKIQGNIFERKYVTIATQSTAQCKYWNYPNGWEQVIEWLQFKGYDVIDIDRDPLFGSNGVWNRIPPNARDVTGNMPIEYRVNQIMNGEFHLGLSSGLSWLAWALHKKVLMVSGHSGPHCEFQEDNYRVFNTDVCNDCWSDPRVAWDPHNWIWCPRHEGTVRHFECTIQITPKMVMDKIEDLIEDLRT